MSNVIKVTQVKIKNLKNVKHGVFKTNTSFDSLEQADILGFYGQNGSGKTVVVEAFH